MISRLTTYDASASLTERKRTSMTSVLIVEDTGEAAMTEGTGTK
jgi:hypothetical protein